MSDILSKSEQILMWELFAAGGAKLNKNILPRPEAKDRKALVKRGFVTVSPSKPTFLIELEDRGWRWIADGEPFPIDEGEKRVTAERRLLQSLMRGIKRAAEAEGKTIQQLFRAKSEASEHPSSVPNRDEAGGEYQHLEDEIRDAFFTLAGRPARDHVRLLTLRKQLARVDRAALDTALLGMRAAGRANLSNLDNPRDIEAEGDAPLKCGSQTFHLLWIDE